MEINFNLDCLQPRLKNVMAEIQRDNGKIEEIFNYDNIIKIMSNISNYIRYDIISKTEIVTYKIPNIIENDIKDFPF
jgi:hypothetical protein